MIAFDSEKLLYYAACAATSGNLFLATMIFRDAREAETGVRPSIQDAALFIKAVKIGESLGERD